ncbi:MAG: MFS transporter [Christensenellales bacterium]
MLLQSEGFSSTEVGLILAVFPYRRCLSPFWGYLADRMKSIPKAFMMV